MVIAWAIEIIPTCVQSGMQEWSLISLYIKMFCFFIFDSQPSQHFGLVVGELSSFCLLFLAVNDSKAGNKLGLGVELVLGLGIRSGIVLGVRLGLGLGLVLGVGVF